MSEVTRILSAIERGEGEGAARLLPLVYEELRKLAAQRMAGERADHTLQATALVHEAYMRLVGGEGEVRWNGRGHFFGAAAEAMRRILVENARKQARLKRGSGGRRVELEAAGLETVRPEDDILALSEALGRLEELQPAKAQVVKLRYFAGLTLEQVAETLGISLATAKRHWAYARAWLYSAIGKPGRDTGG